MIGGRAHSPTNESHCLQWPEKVVTRMNCIAERRVGAVTHMSA